MQHRGEKIFRFGHHCPETQQCPGLRDDTLWNARLGAFGTSFPIFKNDALPALSPKDGQVVLDNARVLFDDESIMHIEGVGTFTGWSAVGSYLAVPHPKVSGLLTEISDLSKTFKVIDDNRVIGTSLRREVWKHIPDMQYDVPWRIELQYYPCSTTIKNFIVCLPLTSTENFISSSQVEGRKEEVCTRIMTECTGEHQQYDSLEDCLAYMEALPVVDPICVDKYGPFAVQGNSFMCKFLHQFMTPFEPHLHCYHAGKGRFDTNRKRKCVPTDCYDESTPSELEPSLLFPPDDVTSATTFEVQDDGTFAETLVLPEITRDASSGYGDDTCTNEEADSIAAATVLTLPFCMSSLSLGVAGTNCTQAVSMLLGRFAENGELCRCRDQVVQRSIMLETLHVDPETIMELASATLENVEIPSCVNSLNLDDCPEVGSYLGRGGCYRWDFAKLESAVYRDWGPDAKFQGRVTTSDAVASSECAVLTAWQQQVKVRDEPDTTFTAPGSLLFPDYASDFVQIHTSLGPVETSYSEVLAALQSHQTRSSDTLMSETCYIGTTLPEVYARVLDSAQEAVGNDILLPPVGHSTGSEFHMKTRLFAEVAYPGMWGDAEDGHTLPEIFDNVVNIRNVSKEDLPFLDTANMRNLIFEIAVRALFKDEFPYTEVEFSDDLDALQPGLMLRPGWSWELTGNLWPAGYMAAKYQMRRHFQESGVLTLEKLQSLLSTAGLDDVIEADGIRGAYGMVANSFVSSRGLSTQVQAMVERVRYDECRAKRQWEEAGPKAFVMEHLRLSPNVGVVAGIDDEQAKMYQLTSAQRDPSVFEDPSVFNPMRTNLHQMLVFNGLESDFDSFTDSSGYFSTDSAPSLKRGCMGRHFSMKMFTQVAPLLFPPKSDEYECGGSDMRVWHGVNFTSDLVTVRDDIQVEVLKADGKESGENLMILVHGMVDVPIGWSMFIRKMRDRHMRQEMDYWSVVMPGWGDKATPIEQCDMARMGGYIADVIRLAKKSYKRVFLFGRDDGGLLAYYAANEVGKEELHGLITNTMPPSLFAVSKMIQPLKNYERVAMLDPISDLYLTGEPYPLESLVKNGTWWKDAWEWEFRSMWKKTGPSQLACLTRSNFVAGPHGTLQFNNLDAARNLDPEMHILTISHEFSLTQPEMVMRYGLKSTTPHPGTVQVFKQMREKPDMYASFYEAEGAEELAMLVSSFVDQSVAIKFSLWSFLNFPIRFDESAYVNEARWPTIFFLVFILTFMIMLSGICGELTVGSILVANASFGVYVCAQVFASILVLGSVLSADPISIPMYTIGLFKFFYPEVTSNIIGPLRHPEVYYSDKLVRFASFCSGICFIPHHVGATLCYVSVIFHETDVYTIAPVSLAVCFQHISALIKYTFPNMYAVVLIGLEVWFQLEVFYLLTFGVTAVKIGVILVLLSHYVWFLEGLLMLVKERIWACEAEGEKKNPSESSSGLKFDRSGKSMRLYRRFADAGGVIPEGNLRQSFGAIGQGDLRESKRSSFWDYNGQALKEIIAAAAETEEYSSEMRKLTGPIAEGNEEDEDEDDVETTFEQKPLHSGL